MAVDTLTLRGRRSDQKAGSGEFQSGPKRQKIDVGRPEKSENCEKGMAFEGPIFQQSLDCNKRREKWQNCNFSALTEGGPPGLTEGGPPGLTVRGLPGLTEIMATVTRSNGWSHTAPFFFKDQNKRLFYHALTPRGRRIL